MRAKVLVLSGVACAAVLGAALLLRSDHPTRAATNRDPRRGQSPAELARKAVEPPKLAPAAQAAMNHAKVSSKELAGGGAEARGASYTARVDSTGLDYRSETVGVRLRASSLEAGDRPAPLGPLGNARRTALNRATIDRGWLLEEYVFENSRVEQIFHVPASPGPGELRIRVDVETDVKGPVEQVRRGQAGWKDATTWDGGLVFKDEKKRPVFAYHGAVAIDASGRRLDLDPRYEDGRIVLEVPDTWMAKASFPVIVDPWLEDLFSASGGGISNTSSVSESPSVALDDSGNPFVAFSDKSSGNFDIYVRHWNGFEWLDIGPGSGTGGVSKNPGESSHPSLARGSDGTLYVTWHDDSRGDFEIYLKKFDGTDWVELAGSASGGGISKNDGLSLFPSAGTVSAYIDRIFIISNLFDEVKNVPVVAWQNDSGGVSEIFVCMYFPGDDDSFEGWFGIPNNSSGPPGPSLNSRKGAGISSTPISVSDRPKLVVDPYGRPLVAWSDTAGGNYDIYLRGVFPTDSGTATPFIVSPSTNSLSISLMTFYVDFGQLDGGGDTGVLIDDGMGGVMRGQATWNEIGGSATAGGISEAVMAASPGLSLYPSLAVDTTSGDLYVAWQESSGAIGSPTDIAVGTSPLTAAPSGTATGTYGGWTATPGSANPGSQGNAVSPSLAVRASFGMTLALLYVAWQDDESGSSEIYVRKNDGSGWSDVGDFGSSNIGGVPGGISNTGNLSFTPTIVANALDQPVIAWADGALGAFDVYVRRFYPNEALSLSQAGLTTGALAAGDFTTDSTVLLTGQLFSETGLTPDAFVGGVRMQVEVREISTPFTGTPTGETFLVLPESYLTLPPVVGFATYSFTGAPNVKYKWRARSIDFVGRASTWISFGSNADDAVDFEVRAPVTLLAPSTLNQRRSSDSTVISPGATVNENTVVLEGFIVPPDASTTVRLEVEVVEGAANAFGTGSTFQSAAQTTAGVAQVTFTAPTNNSYKWRARTISSTGGITGFTDFGGNNPATDPDFIVQTPLPTTLDQRLPDGVTPIPVGGQIGVDNLTFVATVTSPSPSLQVRLEVELRPIATPFTGGGLIQSGLVNSGATVTLASGTILPGTYHWRARTITSTGLTSAFVSFGGNADGTADFTFGVPGSVVGGTGSSKHKCGLTGLEALLALGALGFLRRRLTRRR
jgi:hypothetical protein